MSAQGVFTRMKRVTFVDGQETTTPDPGFVACGPGTRCPLEATLDQIAEVWYRVKDAWFTGGGFSWTISGSDASVAAPTTAPEKRALFIGNLTGQWRGYTLYGADDYNGALYDSGRGDMYSDIADNERGMWRDVYNGENAFTYFSESFDVGDGAFATPPEWWGATSGDIFLIASCGSAFSGRVAVVKTAPANGFFDPTNKFFLEFEFWWSIDGGFFGGWTNIYDGVGGALDPANLAQVCNYIIRLSSGDLSCPIYNGTAGGADFAGTDIIHEATEWWPYAKRADPPAVWDANTGEKLPDAVIFAAFDRDDQQDQIFHLI